MRTVKEPDVRRQEILEAAEKLFVTKGYDSSTVQDILEAVHIAKGTFYYYFKSKEEVLDAMVLQRIERGVKQAQASMGDTNLPVIQKLLALIMAQKPANETEQDLTQVIHEPENAKLHQKMLIEFIKGLSPLAGELIREGIGQGVFSTPYPRESAEILLSAALVLFDDDFFQYTPEEMESRAGAFLMGMERILGAPEGAFAEFTRAFGQLEQQRAPPEAAAPVIDSRGGNP